LALGGTPHPRIHPPIWVKVLQMAEAWGVPPWEIMQQPGSVRWAARWSFYREQLALAQEDMKK